jgi:methyl-accepting chemotaxis protein
MNWLLSFAAAADRLDPAIGRMLEHFRDERVPLRLSLVIAAAAVVLLAALLAWAAGAWWRVERLRRLVRACGRAGEFRENLPRIDDAFAASPFAAFWAEYRHCLKETASGLRYSRRPEEYLGLDALDARAFPRRFFAAAHGYFIGIGLLLTFVGLVAALKFAAAGVASHDLAVAKAALNALLAAAAFKFMTSIAGLGCSLLLSIATRSANFLVEGAARGLAGDLERAMTPLVAESLAYDQLMATRAQTEQLKTLEAALAAAPAAAAASDETQRAAFEQVLTGFLAELRGAAGSEMKHVATKLSHVGDAIGQMQKHIGQSGRDFAEQLGLAATRLLDAATKLEARLDGKAAEAGARLEGVAQGFAALDATVREQVGGMRDIVTALHQARQALDESAASWTTAATPVVAAVEASRQVADRVGAAQRDMAEMAKAVTQLSEKVGTVWESYRTRFEKVDGELQAVFERLQGGTRAFGEEFVELITRLDRSLANGMEAFSLGTDELREVAELLVNKQTAKAA